MARTPKQILQNDYLIARAKIIEVAAVLDRIDRAVASDEGGVASGSLDDNAISASNMSKRTREIDTNSANTDAANETQAISQASIYADPSYQKIRNAIAILNDSDSEKARRIQELLSRPYESNWKQQFDMPQK